MRIVSLFTWKSPMIAEALCIGLVAFSAVLYVVPLRLVILVGVLFVWIDKGRERYHLKPAKKIKMRKKGDRPLPLDILERLPDKVTRYPTTTPAYFPSALPTSPVPQPPPLPATTTIATAKQPLRCRCLFCLC